MQIGIAGGIGACIQDTGDGFYQYLVRVEVQRNSQTVGAPLF
jgi:hypothetical protein